MTTEHDDTGSNRRTPHPRPTTSSPNSSSTATAPSRTNPTRGRCPKRDIDRRRRRRHLRRPGCDPGRHPPRTRPRRSALVDGQPLPPRHRPDRTRTRRQRAGAEAQPEGTGWLGDPLGRTGTPHRRGADADRAPRQHGVLPRPGRRAVRAPHRLSLAAARRIDGQPPHADLGDDRQPRLPRRQTPGRDRGAAACRPEDRLHRRARLQRSPADLGQARQGPRQASRHGAAARRIAEGCRAHRRRAGPITARCRRSPSSPTGRSTPRRRRSSATTRCWTVLPIGVMVFPGTGIQDNLADKARKLGIPVWKFGRAARERRLPPLTCDSNLPYCYHRHRLWIMPSCRRSPFATYPMRPIAP